jgi:predicted dehydrogenase
MSKNPVFDKINWGIIGCGDVAEIKSGPAFQKVENSALVAVMRRDAAKAADFAIRHQVPYWFSDADELLACPEINAVYIATPPTFHAEYAMKAALAGKIVYVEKPMAKSYRECQRIVETCSICSVPLFIAYYRRSMPYFLKVKEIIDSGVLGEIRFVNIDLFQSQRLADLSPDNQPWRLMPEFAGMGGYFYDMASHQIDLMLYFFGKITKVEGFSLNRNKLASVFDTFSAQFLHRNKVLISGRWCFSASEMMEKDEIEVIGTRGKLIFSSFAFTPIKLKTVSKSEIYEPGKPEHVQMPFIAEMVKELTGYGKCPGNVDDAVETNRIMEIITGEYLQH